jgi:ABC-2 type transport system ATP-binding protein
MIVMDEVVTTINLSRYFGNVVALDNINITINKGEIFGLLGPNGSGKSTLIKILATLLLPSKGEAYVFGFDVKTQYDKIRRMINIVAGDDRPGYGILKVKESLWFFSQLYGYGIKEGWKVVNSLIEKFNMQDFAERRINRLSSGMMQKYNFVRGILNNPKLLFLDEPTIGLDVNAANEIRSYIKEWIKEDGERTILLTTHYMAEAQQLCDRIAIIHKGRIIKIDTVEGLLKLVSNEHVFEIKTPLIPEKLMDSLKKIEGMKALDSESDVSSYTTNLRIVVSDESIIADVISSIKASGTKILALSKVEPTLEDVFLYLVGRKLK